MRNRIIEICELGQPQSIIQRENEPISELIKTDSLIEELNEQLLLYNVVGQSEQFVCYRCKKLEFMIDNGLGWEDMDNDNKPAN